MSSDESPPQPRFWESIKEELRSRGLDFDELCCLPDGTAVKVVCVPYSLRKSVQEVSGTPRDQVVMVRVDAETARKLDAWLATGAVRSRSEAAAVFIREGMRLREEELQELQQAVAEVERAKERLRRKAKEVLGAEDEVPRSTAGESEDLEAS